MSAEKVTLDLNASIQKHISMLKPMFPQRAIISIGDYSSQILLKSADINENEELLKFFVQKTKQGKSKSKKTTKENNETIGIDEKADTHYWFNVQKYIAEHDAIVEKLKSKPIDELYGAIMVASLWEGVGSALLPDLTARFQEGNVNSVAFAIVPSHLQPADAQFNTLWSMAKCMTNGLTQILIEREALENYVGVDRKGSVLKGNRVLNYVIELALEKEEFNQEFLELSKSFNLKMFTALVATGASLKIYGSFKNILDSTLIRPFIQFDMSTATMLYVLVRAPRHLKEKLSQSQIEFWVEEWFNEKTSLKSVHVSEPIYVEDLSDRIDLILFVGGFDLAEMVESADKKAKEIKVYAEKNGYIKEKEWQDLIKVLTD